MLWFMHSAHTASLCMKAARKRTKLLTTCSAAAGGGLVATSSQSGHSHQHRAAASAGRAWNPPQNLGRGGAFAYKSVHNKDDLHGFRIIYYLYIVLCMQSPGVGGLSIL